MKRIPWMTVLVVGVAFATGFLVRANGKPQSTQQGSAKMKTMTIKWQRLVGSAGKTCERCGTTQAEVRRAYASLRKALSALGINVVLQERALDKATAAKNIAESNRMWIAGKPLETWLDAKTGASECTSCGSLCGEDVDCRTVVVAGRAYESIPSALIVKAGLLAAAEIVGGEAAQPCCGTNNSSGVRTITDGACGSGGCK